MKNIMTMDAIDTFYNGNFYRSRLEARWACFFDSISIKYEYEPQGYKSGNNGSCYLPDFRLLNVSLRDGNDGVFLEIKPESYTLQTIPAAEWFTLPLVLFCGTPEKNLYNRLKDYEGGFELVPRWDCYMGIYKCSKCGHSKIDFSSDYDECHICKAAEPIDLFILAESVLFKRFEHRDRRDR